MPEFVPVLLAALALALALAGWIIWRWRRPDERGQRTVLIDFDTYKYREENERQTRNGW